MSNAYRDWAMDHEEEMEHYPCLKELGIEMIDGAVGFDDVNIALADKDLSSELFDELFGVQICPIMDGELCMYAWDCEAVLEVMLSGKLTGTQLMWD